jgi:hypothetical protein
MFAWRNESLPRTTANRYHCHGAPIAHRGFESFWKIRVSFVFLYLEKKLGLRVREDRTLSLWGGVDPPFFGSDGSDSNFICSPRAVSDFVHVCMSLTFPLLALPIRPVRPHEKSNVK